MNASRWERVQTLFHLAADLPEADRRSYVEAECPDDPTVAAEVMSMLDEDRRASSGARGCGARVVRGADHDRERDHGAGDPASFGAVHRVTLACRPRRHGYHAHGAGIPEWPKGAGCKPAGSAFGGSNPPPCIVASVESANADSTPRKSLKRGSRAAAVAYCPAASI